MSIKCTVQAPKETFDLFGIQNPKKPQDKDWIELGTCAKVAEMMRRLQETPKNNLERLTLRVHVDYLEEKGKPRDPRYFLNDASKHSWVKSRMDASAVGPQSLACVADYVECSSQIKSVKDLMMHNNRITPNDKCYLVSPSPYPGTTLQTEGHEAWLE